MRIAITGNVFPFGVGKAYGGERIVHYLIKGLKALGHDLVLFASKGHTVEPELLEAYIEVAGWGDHGTTDVHAIAAREYEQKVGKKFDVYQCNYFGDAWDKSVTEQWPYVELVWCAWCHLHHQAGAQAFNTVSYSRALQRAMNRSGCDTTMIHYGIPIEEYPLGLTPKDYLVWIGKLEGGKGADWAIEVAKRSGRKLVIMGPPYNPTHMVKDIFPRMNDQIIWLRGVDDEMKKRVFKDAFCFLSANVDGWQEMFGIVNIESMACGTPVLGWTKDGDDASGVLRDKLIQDGVNGHLIHYSSSAAQWEEKIVEAVGLLNGPIAQINSTPEGRTKVRASIEPEYSHMTMARRFEWLHKEAIAGKRHTVADLPV